MLYFVGYPPNQASWTGNFTRAVREELTGLRIPFVELPPYDWTGATAPKREYLKINSKPEDAWLIGWAQSSLIELIKHKQGRKYGLVVGLTESHFDPLIFTGEVSGFRERQRLNAYDRLFANSRWCGDCISRAYPELAGRVAVTGFPFDFSLFENYLHLPKEENLVVFNQRFALEKLHVLEVEAARLLIKKGFRVQHLSGIPAEKLQQKNPLLGPLLDTAQQIGLEFVYSPGKDEYHRNLAKASFVLTTSIADMLPSSLIEAIYIGAVPVAPRAFCFPEFVHRDNLYTPYDLEEVLSIVAAKPRRKHRIHQYSKKKVIRCMLKEMARL